jgi:kumamolisin
MSPTVYPLVALPHSERPPLPGAVRVGDADPQQMMTMTIILRRRRSAEKPPVGPPFLTEDELAAQYGADPSDVSRILELAQRMGAQVVEASEARRTVVLAATVGTCSRALGVRFGIYAVGSIRYRGYEGPIKVPADLASAMVAVLGMDDRPQARPLLHATPIGERPRRHDSGPYSPVEIAQAYGFPSGDGGGQCIGIIELGGGFAKDDLDTFFGNLGLGTPTVGAVSVDGAANSPGGDADGEVGLDIEVAGAVAPQATMAVYFTPNTDAGFLDAITTATHDQVNKPSVISISWGSAETQWSKSTLQAFNMAFQDAAALGVTVFCSSGDDGSNDGTSEPNVDFPASSPYVVACGGTTLAIRDGAISSEVAWPGTGGGVSRFFPLTSWQRAAKVPAAPSGFHGRGVPDVAGDADPNTGYLCFIGGTWMQIGGTSAVAPLWAGLIALINARRGARSGLITPTLYANPGALRDIITGSNGLYSAGAGWNACTGYGTPNGPMIAKLLG